MFEQYAKILEARLSAKRFRHSLGVSRTAVSLARRYGADPEKAQLAGLLHDCAREMPSNILLQKAEANAMLLNDVELSEPKLLHAPVGVIFAYEDFGVTDPEVLSAIRWHTTGGPTMSVLDQIIFLADYIEPGRFFPGVDTLRQLAEEDLPAALLAAYDQSILYLLGKGVLIHPATVEGRNALLKKK